MLYKGHVRTLLRKLEEALRGVSLRGPGTKAKREALRKVIHYLEARVKLMDEVRPEIWTRKRRGLWNTHSRTCGVLLTILAGEFLGRQIAQRRVNSLGIVHIIEEPTQLPPGVGEVLVL